MAKHTFQTEITQLLDLMINSLYSNKEIFLRELVSNASDALDKLNYLTLSDEKFKDIKFSPRIDISFEESKSITISDNGIGMDENDLVEHLGTIAKSGTKNFLSTLSGDKKKDSALIGQFGVGFYSAFMVADKIVVQTKKAGSDNGYAWISDGKGEYEISECVKEEQGTSITLYLKNQEQNFASKWGLNSIISKYSNHIVYPIYLTYTKKEDDKSEQVVEQVNSAKALWRVSKSEIKDDDYKEFYKTLSGDSQDPMAWIHTKVEGNLEYSTLFFIPSVAPFDLYRVDYKSGVKLYVKRVFITDDDKELLPTYLRFIKGVIDTEDLPLNVSREIIQQNKILSNIKSASVKKILGEIEKISNDKKEYEKFYSQFGNVLKEGLYSDFENKDKILELLRFSCSQMDEKISLKDYADGISKDQKYIYYMLGDNLEILKNSSALEKYRAKNIKVLLLSDEIDALVMPSVGKYGELELRDINSKEALDELGADISDEDKKQFASLMDKIKNILGDEVSDVRLSNVLTSPMCVIAQSKNPMMENLMMQMGQKMPHTQSIEININHDVIKKLNTIEDEKLLKDSIVLLYGNAKIISGGSVQNISEFSQRLNDLVEKSLVG